MTTTPQTTARIITALALAMSLAGAAMHASPAIPQDDAAAITLPAPGPIPESTTKDRPEPVAGADHGTTHPERQAEGDLGTMPVPQFAQDNTYGTGNCSVWQKIKQVMTGVFCGYL